jgi:hypothetical protein
MLDLLPEKIKQAIEAEVIKVMKAATTHQFIIGSFITERKIMEDHEVGRATKEAMNKIAEYIYHKGMVKGAQDAVDVNGQSSINAAIIKVRNFENEIKEI